MVENNYFPSSHVCRSAAGALIQMGLNWPAAGWRLAPGLLRVSLILPDQLANRGILSYGGDGNARVVHTNTWWFLSQCSDLALCHFCPLSTGQNKSRGQAKNISGVGKTPVFKRSCEITWWMTWIQGGVETCPMLRIATLFFARSWFSWEGF